MRQTAKGQRTVTLYCHAICGIGRIRHENQDNLYANGAYREDISDNSTFRHTCASRGFGLYAVADGLGGESHGGLASLAAVQAMGELGHGSGVVGDAHLGVPPASGGRRHSFRRRQDIGRLERYIHERNEAICGVIADHGGERAGSTFVGLWVDGDTAIYANIGDSRAYLLRGKTLTQLSRDHTPVRQMIELGILDRRSARVHPSRHRLTQHLGIPPSEMLIDPHSGQLQASQGDLFLLCSDGLTDMLDDDAIESALNSALNSEPNVEPNSALNSVPNSAPNSAPNAPGDVKNGAEALYSSALDAGGKDNITILLVRCG